MNWKRLLLPAVMSLCLLFPLSASAAAWTVGSEHALSAAAIDDGSHARKMKHKWHCDGFNVHYQAYLSLLVAKYTPADSAKWQKAFDERNKWVTEFKKLKAVQHENRDQMKLKMRTEPDKTARKQTTEQRMQRQAEHQKIAEAHHKLFQEFTAAIKKGDATAITAILPKMLEQFTQDTARLKQKVEKMKAAK